MKGMLTQAALLISMGVSASTSEQSRWDFKVLLDNREIGSHYFTVSDEDGRQTIDTEAHFDVKLLFVSLYSYRHKNQEVWQGDCLRSISASTDDNGKDFVVQGSVVKGSLDQANFQLSSNATIKQLPDCVKTFAYWNPAFLKEDKLLNSQTGEYEDVNIARVGDDIVEVNGKAIAAVKYTVDLDKGPITLWYSAGDYRWLALESVAGGGRVLRYEPVSVPQTALNL